MDRINKWVSARLHNTRAICQSHLSFYILAMKKSKNKTKKTIPFTVLSKNTNKFNRRNYSYTKNSKYFWN